MKKYMAQVRSQAQKKVAGRGFRGVKSEEQIRAEKRRAKKEKEKPAKLAKQTAARKMALAKMRKKMAVYRTGSRKYKAAMIKVTFICL